MWSSDLLGRIGFDDEVFRVATDRVDTRHARHRLQLRADDPVLHGSQIAGLLNLVGQPVPLRSEITSVGLPAGLSGNLLRALAVRIGIAKSEEHTSELQSLMRISYAVFCLKKKTYDTQTLY